KALIAAQKLFGVAASVRIVVLPDLPAKGDVSDWLDADPSRGAKLADICFEAPLWTPETAEVAAATGDKATSSRVPWTVPVLPWRDPETIPRRVFLYGHHYARGFVSATIADGGIGKSLLKIAEFLTCASGL